MQLQFLASAIWMYPPFSPLKRGVFTGGLRQWLRRAVWDTALYLGCILHSADHECIFHVTRGKRCSKYVL